MLLNHTKQFETFFSTSITCSITLYQKQFFKMQYMDGHLGNSTFSIIVVDEDETASFILSVICQYSCEARILSQGGIHKLHGQKDIHTWLGKCQLMSTMNNYILLAQRSKTWYMSILPKREGYKFSIVHVDNTYMVY